MPEYRQPRQSRFSDPLAPLNNGHFIIFELLAKLFDHAYAGLAREHGHTSISESYLNVQLWSIVQSAWNAHLTDRDLYVGDLLRPGVTSETLHKSVSSLIELGWLSDTPPIDVKDKYAKY